MDPPKSTQHSKKEILKQPVSCPWVTVQPYPSSPLSNKNRSCGQKRNSNVQINNCLNNHWNNGSTSIDSTKMFKKSSFCSMQQSSSQFFHFLRLMQLFPQTHPATLHTVLYLCKNDFFCAIDKLLYAKRCKMLYNSRRSQLQQHKTQGKSASLGVSSPLMGPSTLTSQKRSYLKSQMTSEDICREVKLSKVGEHNNENYNLVAEEKEGLKLKTQESETRSGESMHVFGVLCSNDNSRVRVDLG
ncbi:hypothetical protein HHI36_012772 [Cryptolaemus montrouzieri]|uniref:Uncharacterized protein n=1 Tax=Cryptolaemus montrouzieri TaxID=559131 RepID=A0ABD2NFP4_9CUCU